MSWYINRAGNDKELLKAAVQAETAPQDVKDEICRRIDAQPIDFSKPACIMVNSVGHKDMTAPADRPWAGVDRVEIFVRVAEFAAQPPQPAPAPNPAVDPNAPGGGTDAGGGEGSGVGTDA